MEIRDQKSADRTNKPLSRILFSFQGRINRVEFWLVWLGLFVCLLAVYLPWQRGSSGVPFFVMVFPALWIGTAIQVKRWHDLGLSGWYFFVNFIPYLGSAISMICLGFIPGTKGVNKYDEVPATPDEQAQAQSKFTKGEPV
ncbi:MAG: DUF805 domain-containing protein [Elusimicrobia bacterium]|nr:DUF805 domain-containing protein [Elusimicrobiota bacterium]